MGMRIVNIYDMIKRVLPVFERLLSLLVVFLLVLSSVLWTGRIFGTEMMSKATEPAEGRPTPVPTADELQLLGLDRFRLSQRDSASWEVLDHEGNRCGILVGSHLLAKGVTGFSGPTPVYVWMSPSGRIEALASGENSESPNFFDKAEKGGFSQYAGRNATEVAELQVDGVSGATYSQEGLAQNIRAVLTAYAGTLQADGIAGPAIGWPRLLALLAVLVFGLVVSWRFRKVPALRLTVLALNVGVTGFWCGQFLSFSVFRGFVQNEMQWLVALPLLLLLLLAIVMPYFGRPGYYCSWVCPYGSLQELVWRLPLPKVRVSARIFKWMSRVRMATLMLLLLWLWAGMGAEILDYEPFSAFLLTSAQPVVLILAGVFVLAGMFVPRLWCHCLCPTGALLHLAERDK